MKPITPKTPQAMSAVLFKKGTILCYVLLLLLFNISPFSSIIGQHTALNFDGHNDYVNATIDELSTGNPAHTIETWMYIDALPANRSWPLNLGQFNTGSHHWLLQANGDFVIGVFGAASAQIKTTIPVGTWTHIAAAFDGTNLKAYVNGELIGTVTGNFNLWNQTLHLGRPWSNENYFDGTLDEVRIWNTAITQEQIQLYKDNTLAGYEEYVAGLIANYAFSEGEAGEDNSSLTTVSDNSGKENIGTLNNFAKTGNSSNWVAGLSLCRVNGAYCDDQNPDTSWDTADGNCNCMGSCDFEGQPCDDGDDQTIYDYYYDDCGCYGDRGCIVGDLSSGNGGQFIIYDQLCCSVNNDGINGEVHITLQGIENEYIYPELGVAYCNGTSKAIVKRGTKRFRGESTAQSRNNNGSTNDRLLYRQTWTIKGSGPCSDEIFAVLEVYVYAQNNLAHLMLNQNTILSDTLAANTITALGTIPNSEEVTFLATTSIILKPGFTVEKNASFAAKIAPNVNCSNVASLAAEKIPTIQKIKIENKVLTSSPSLMVYPNPFSTFTTIDYQLTKPTKVTLSLLSLTGQVIKKLETLTPKHKGNYSLTLDNTTLTKGIYLISLQTDTQQLIHKVVLQ